MNGIQTSDCNSFIYQTINLFSVQIFFNFIYSWTPLFQTWFILNSTISIFCPSVIYYQLFFELPVLQTSWAVASWLVRSTLDRVVLVLALAGDIALCSWARHPTLMPRPLSTQDTQLSGPGLSPPRWTNGHWQI